MARDVLVGGCLCGRVRYAVDGPLLRFAHCHCSRCRRATGSAHASNVYAEPSGFRWTSGEPSTRRYDLASAESFSTTFCIECGAPLPHHTRSGREIVIPAGSLDEDPPIAPQVHIFYPSRPAWSCQNAGVPTADEYGSAWQRPSGS